MRGARTTTSLDNSSSSWRWSSPSYPQSIRESVPTASASSCQRRYVSTRPSALPLALFTAAAAQLHRLKRARVTGALLRPAYKPRSAALPLASSRPTLADSLATRRVHNRAHTAQGNTGTLGKRFASHSQPCRVVQAHRGDTEGPRMRFISGCGRDGCRAPPRLSFGVDAQC